MDDNEKLVYEKLDNEKSKLEFVDSLAREIYAIIAVTVPTRTMIPWDDLPLLYKGACLDAAKRIKKRVELVTVERVQRNIERLLEEVEGARVGMINLAENPLVPIPH